MATPGGTPFRTCLAVLGVVIMTTPGRALSYSESSFPYQKKAGITSVALASLHSPGRLELRSDITSNHAPQGA